MMVRANERFMCDLIGRMIQVYNCDTEHMGALKKHVTGKAFRIAIILN